jgi:hypothetical protein
VLQLWQNLRQPIHLRNPLDERNLQTAKLRPMRYELQQPNRSGQTPQSNSPTKRDNQAQRKDAGQRQKRIQQVL